MTCLISSTGFEEYIACKNECEKPYTAIKYLLYEIILEAFSKGVNSFYTNCEYGIPLWCAEIICTLKLHNDIKLHIVIPYEEQSTNWSEDLRDRYYAVHEKADTVQFASTRYSINCYHIADEIMAENSDMIYIFGKTISEIPMCNCVHKSKNKWILM